MKRMNQASLAAAVSACLLAANPAQAITNVEANAGPQFNFVNPGARSLGMAGAFIGLADDSTAAYTNAAGLAQLTRPEFSAELRYSEFGTTSVRNGRLMDSPTGYGLDTLAGLRTQETERDITNLSFLSYAFPISNGTLAVYRHELANFEAGFASEGPFTLTFSDAVDPPLVSRILPSTNDVDLKIVNYGFSGSWRVGSEVMLGGGINYYQFDFDTVTNRFDLDGNRDGVVSADERLTVLDFSDPFRFNILRQIGNDSGFGFNLGLLWQPNDQWSFGAVYRKGPDFDYHYTAANGLGTVLYENDTDFVVPDVWGIGIGYRPNDAWRVSLDLARVGYADHAANVVSHSRDADAPYLGLKDTTEARLGVEYTAIEAKRPYSIRFGVWHEPAHQIYFTGQTVPYTGTNLTAAQLEINSRAAMFVRGEDQWHYTAGFGMVFDKFQIDAAFDGAERTKTFSLSLVYFLK